MRLLLFPLLVSGAILFAQQSNVTQTTSADADFPGSISAKAGDHLTDAVPDDFPQMPGWPQTVPVAPLYVPSGIKLADLNGDGKLETIVGSTDGNLYAWSFEGMLLPGFPAAVGGRIQSAPAVGDIDGDGSPDIAVCSVGTSPKVAVYRANGTLMTGWPQSILTNAFGFSSPVLFDLDGDGKLEVIHGAGSNTGNLGRINVWKFDGSSYPGWPQTLGASYRIISTVSVGDIDGDGLPEIVAVGKKAGADTVKVFAYHRDSTQVAGWPYAASNVGSSWSAAAIGNVDTTTPTDEVVFVAANFNTGVGFLYCVRSNGSDSPGFPAQLPFAQAYPSIVLGDADRDGSLEIVCGGLNFDSRQYMFRSDGTVMPGWPQFFPTNIEGTAVLVDVDTSSDGFEVLNGNNYTSNASFYGFTVMGGQAANFPLTMAGSMSVNSAAVGDVDGNGTMEIALVNSNGTVNLWATGMPYDSTKVEWGTFYHDNFNTNDYRFRVPSLTHVNGEGEIPTSLSLEQNYPNPFNPATRISFTIPEENHVTLKIFDVLGREMSTLVDRQCLPGSYSVQWNAAGYASGVYFYRLSSSFHSQTKRMLLLR